MLAVEHVGHGRADRARRQVDPADDVAVGLVEGRPQVDGRDLQGEQTQPPQVSALAGRGRYSELDREDDQAIALRIVQEIRSRSPRDRQEETVAVYWQFLLAAAGALGLALLFTRDRVQLWLQVAGVLVGLAVLVGLTA